MFKTAKSQKILGIVVGAIGALSILTGGYLGGITALALGVACYFRADLRNA